MRIKNRPLEIQSAYAADGSSYLITLLNVIFQEDSFNKINKLIKALILEDELFFGFYRTDGLTLSKEEMAECDILIPSYFKNNGEYKELVERRTDKKGRIKEYSGYLTIARSQITNQLYDNLKWFLQYYLETVFFPPNVSFAEFENAYISVMTEPFNKYIVKGYTSILFRYYDSGDFSVSFDHKKYDVKQVRELIDSIFRD